MLGIYNYSDPPAVSGKSDTELRSLTLDFLFPPPPLDFAF